MSKRLHIVVTLIINGIVPWLLYVLLSNYMTSLLALSIATLVPLVENILYIVKNKKIDAFGAIMLFTFIVAIFLVLLGGSEKLLLIRESFITASVGLIFLLSLLFKRPIIYYLALRFTVNNNESDKNIFSENWTIPYFRQVIRIMTTVWGVALVLEAIVRTFLVFELSTVQFLFFSNFVLYGFIGATILWTAMYRRRASERLQDIKLNK